MLQFKDRDLEFLAYVYDGLTFYDAQDINKMYGCASMYVQYIQGLQMCKNVLSAVIVVGNKWSFVFFSTP